MSPVHELNKILTETFGKKTTGLIARCPAWGNDDYCFIIFGKHAVKASLMLALKFGAKMTTKYCDVQKCDVVTLEWTSPANS